MLESISRKHSSKPCTAINAFISNTVTGVQISVSKDSNSLVYSYYLIILSLLSFFSAAYTLYLYAYRQHGKIFPARTKILKEVPIIPDHVPKMKYNVPISL
uniref:Uncharacterized protein n=1 Tax=Glossina morsitans morsitans TaxID=37546 RepID=A0A1B0FB31_GLOMM